MLTRGKDWEDVRTSFRWQIPERYNIGVDICDRWAETEPDREAIAEVAQDGSVRRYSFGELRTMTDKLASALAGRGVGRRAGEANGDRIGVLLPQRIETAVAHIAALKLGAISIPLFTLFGPEALMHRLADSGASVVVTDVEGAAKLAALRPDLPDLKLILCVDGPQEGCEDFETFCAGGSSSFTPVDTAANDSALIIYTSGTTGAPKGALHAHRVLLGHLPGVEISHDFLPQPGDRMWTPADWAWIGGLLDVLMPALHHGVPVVAHRFRKFTGEGAFAFIAEHGIRNTFLPPTALKMMRLVPPEKRASVDLRSVASGGETLGVELIEWGRDALGVTINEFYGQTECNMVVSSCAELEPAKPGVMGRPSPGHEVIVVDEDDGSPLAVGEEGAIAVRAPDPVMFLGYWNRAEATAEKFVTGDVNDGWMLMGDRGVIEDDGRIRFIGRDDDVISSAGYRIGPAEVEDCLLRHPAVKMAGVVGWPDDLRGHVVAAFIVLAEEAVPSDELAKEIAEFVKSHLAAHEYPRIIRFVDEMPMTTTGKIIRAKLRETAAQEAG
ncbi:AMP-binding protein [Notoacmeibacter ruber]|uniref:AMP-dependent synthetase n=1 Tax=Notoacmeibacter ruber TaxID=2670375 RepID=A0A3L7JDI1_9HYPH|nr:AMP-binding protein [Notoacmeibacter ruber]RLQ88530.1 AMP-dependent synthetase [Notoacmeibacter ruber]